MTCKLQGCRGCLSFSSARGTVWLLSFTLQASYFYIGSTNFYVHGKFFLCLSDKFAYYM
ncbi:hypothetical protein ACE6H2_011987 [Prunus campanulata]